MRRSRYLSIGSISEGTLRPEDIVPELLWVAERYLAMSREDRNTIRRLGRESRPLLENDPEGDLLEISIELQDLLQSYAPPGCYVGSHEGDGAAIGCWPSSDVPATEEDDPEPIDRAAKWNGEGVVFKVSDHGNILGVWSRSYTGDPRADRWHYLSL